MPSSNVKGLTHGAPKKLTRSKVCPRRLAANAGGFSPVLTERRVLVTGGAGFIGSHLCDRLLERGDRVMCVDNFDSFYDPQLKRRNVEVLQRNTRFQLIEADIRDRELLEEALGRSGQKPDVIVHLAARA